jgi:hypothetical protein
MTTEDRLKALRAGKILNDDVFLDCLEALDADYVAAWRASKTPEEREKCWYMQNALAAIRHRLFKQVQDAAISVGATDKELKAVVQTAKEKKCRSKKA